MIALLAPAFFAALVALALNGAPADWAHIRVRWQPLALGALLVQLVLFNPPLNQQPWALEWGPWIWVISMVGMLAAFLRNAATGGRSGAAWLAAGLGVLLIVLDLATMPGSLHSYSPLLALVLLVACAAAQRLTFQVHRGWETHASTTPHLAAAFLLPPGLAILVGAGGAFSYELSRRAPAGKALFNVASIALAVAASAHIAANLGGPSLLTADGGWSGLLVALIATIAQYTVSVVTVAGAVALDQRRSFWQIAWRRLSFKVLVEAILGAIGAMFAAVRAAA